MNQSVNYSVLVVDDSPNLLETLKILLEYYHFEVLTAQSGKRALKLLNQRNFDAVVCDIRMPTMSGLELLERIKTTINPDLPVILMTGYITAEYAVEAVRLGASDFIGKPIDAGSIVRTLRTQIDKRKSVKKLAIASNKYISNYEMNFQFKPSDFFSKNLVTGIVSHFENYKEISPSIVNSLSICIDELLNNAFIHGIFEVSSHDRSKEHEDFVHHIKSIMKNKNIKDKKIRLNLKMNRDQRTIQITIKDDGKGFDSAHVMRFKESTVEFTGTGRGLYLIQVLTDELTFSNNGTQITILKRF